METGKVLQLKPDQDVNANLEKIQDSLTDVEHETTEDEKQSIRVITRVFYNELIWKTLGHCLNVSDLKCCRLVNRKFSRLVMDETKFKDRVVLKVKKNKLTADEFGKTAESWKKLSLNFPVNDAVNPTNYNWLYPLLAEVEFLSLRLHGKVTASDPIDFHPLLEQLLASCKKLKSLALELDFIRAGLSYIFEGTETLENLQELEILQPASNRMRGDGDPRMQLRMATEDFCPKLKNLKIYRTYFPRFRTNPLPDYLDPRTTRIQNEAMFLYCVSGNIFHSNRQHLESHSFYDMSNMSLTGRAQEADFMFETPALVALEVDSSQLEGYGNVQNLITYLGYRPSLEQLDISCPLYDAQSRLVLSGLIIAAVSRHRMSLKKLKLVITPSNLSNWSFLRESSLQEFRLEDQRPTAGENEWIRQVMTNLPKSIEKLYLRGAVLERGQKKKEKSQTEPLKTEHFARLDPKLVTQLSIFNAGGLVDNDVADLICRNFKMLRKLNLSEAQTDDEGFTEIVGIKGLQFLTLKCCGISDVTLKRIRFLELRYLDVAGNLQTTVAGMKMAMKECPSLETVLTSVPECSFTKEDGLKICPRLKFLVQSNDDGAPPDQ